MPRHPEVPPVHDADIDAALPYMSASVRTMVMLQRLTGMRPGEVVCLTTSQIDRTTDPWIFRPSKHKTTHRNRDRAIPIGPKAPELLTPRLRTDPDKPLFCPRESRAQFDANRPNSG